ncbi:MAG TPA: aminoacyl-tRNA hydrolase [Ruminococcaceae bacterium]|nr:aminoacyl-tRNA hydrolase [Oscillospiraceae bacterium]
MLFNGSNMRQAAGPVEYIVAGLGNPGREYEKTRHNAGFLALDKICERYSFKIDRLKFKSLCGDAVVGGKRVLFLKPSTYMNNSGEAIRDAMQFYKVPIQNVLVVFDDISLDVGKMRIRRKGTDGGHNGIKNIIYLTGSDDFPRIKIGVGQKPHPDFNLADWVLSSFSRDDLKLLDEVFDKTCDAVRLIIEGRISEAMNKYN